MKFRFQIGDIVRVDLTNSDLPTDSTTRECDGHIGIVKTCFEGSRVKVDGVCYGVSFRESESRIWYFLPDWLVPVEELFPGDLVGLYSGNYDEMCEKGEENVF